MIKTLEEAIVQINFLTKTLEETNKKLKPLLVERALKKQHEERKIREIYEN